MGWTGGRKEMKGQAGVTACDVSGVEVTGAESQCGEPRLSACHRCYLTFGPKSPLAFSSPLPCTDPLAFSSPLPCTDPECFLIAVSCFFTLNMLPLHEGQVSAPQSPTWGTWHLVIPTACPSVAPGASSLVGISVGL